MSHTNPHFMREERSPYEFCNLLSALPKAFDVATVSITDEQHSQIMAADEHAANYATTLLNGLESMGRMLYSAAQNTVSPLALSDVAQVGSFLSEIAVQLQYLEDFRGAVAGHNLHTAWKAGQK